MANLWEAAAWVVPVFTGASGALVFGYLRFLRWSQADERQAAIGDVIVGQVPPLGGTRSDSVTASVDDNMAA
jgi:hypothetical protein